MSSELWAAAIGGGAGLATGAVSALLAPWARWAIDKRQIKMQHQLRILTQAREGLAAFRRTGVAVTSMGWYQQLRPYMTSEAIAVIEGPRLPIVTDEQRKARRQNVAGTLSEETARIERNWKLRK
ncbi:hypothetical protein CH251_04965 [Rhodococcus sp. 06-462-5]|uniref:hypothetical protein n=1 Tax=unclassified Rhodococcus (in: high G+C Gram-positive bacteria) TaxID=192944 RepID=UPI000B9B4CB4|nr:MULTISPECIES: hypothetical protein [unclassified Rhodococcus (in: high G+C Gram-positive bacteria)]OZC78008.1 hypothetical protein CH251_04965 [Rhodococcus sp. 06-462-5]OZE61860.1 hypothetical protein CH270_19355 [Rhodococcus sp. 02-925g]